MLDPPPDLQDARSIALPIGSCHLRRVCRIQSNEPKCEHILLLSNTRFGRTEGVNNVVLSCPDNINIRDCHAVICSEQLNDSTRRYELLAHHGASVLVNGFQIETDKRRQLFPGDSITFGDKLSDGFTFQFELADSQLEYPVIKQNLRSNVIRTLTIFNDSLAFKVGTLRTTIEEVKLSEPAAQFNYEKAVQPELIFNILKASRQHMNISAKENLLLDYCPSIPIIADKIAASAIHGYIEVGDGTTLHATPLNLQQPSYKVQLPTKFDVDLIEVAKRIASRIVKHDSCNKHSIDEYDQQNNNVNNSHLQVPMIASVTNLNVYPCNASLTPSSSISPPLYSDYQHTSETSSSTSFNHSDSGNFSANESGNNSFNTSNISQLSSECGKNEEKSNEEQENEPTEVKKAIEELMEVDQIGEKSNKSDSQRPLPKSSSAARLEMLAALASSSNSQSFDDEIEQKPLEIFIPLATCSDRDDSLSPAQTVKSEKILSPTSGNPHRLSKLRSSRQSTHDADDSHIHTTKQLKTQAGIEMCRRRMLKYIANNLYTAQIVKQFQPELPPTVLKLQNEKPVVEQTTDEPKIEMPNTTNEVPRPLNLYPDGEEYVTKAGKQRRNSKKQTLSETVTDADQLLFATLLMSVRATNAPSTHERSHSSTSNSPSVEDVVVEEKMETDENLVTHKKTDLTEKMEVANKTVGPKKPSREEEQLLLEAERKVPKLTGIGRHTMAKLRLLYRANLDRSSSATIPTQRHRLVEKCRENRVKCEEKQKQVQKKLQAAGKRRMAKRSSEQLPSPNGRNLLGSPIARMPIVKKSSNPSKLQNSSKRQSTDFSSLSIHQLAKDPNFDGFLSEDYGACKKTDPFYFNEEEDPFTSKKNSTPQNQWSLFNARPAAISANASIHNQQHKKSRKRQESGQPSADTPIKQKGRRNSSTPKTKKGRIAGRGGPGRKPKKSAAEKEEEPCASMDCCPKKVQQAAASGVINWTACDTCSLWLHTYCAFGVNRPVGDDENFQCHRCRTMC